MCLAFSTSTDRYSPTFPFFQLPCLEFLYNCRMRPAINLLSHFATLRNRATTILVSTTGKKDGVILSLSSQFDSFDNLGI